MSKNKTQTAVKEEVPAQVRMDTKTYLDNRITAIEGEMKAMTQRYAAHEAVLAELKRMRESVAD